jgi:hypothetical protein
MRRVINHKKFRKSDENSLFNITIVITYPAGSSGNRIA